jgi:hypothetical protein
MQAFGSAGMAFLEEVVFLSGIAMAFFWITSLSLGMAMASPMCTCT